MTIKAIETRYAGCRFRSRLEARWAVFFDHAGIKWEYETQGYVVGEDTAYLPDFWLPELKTWVEIKGSEDNLNVETLIKSLDGKFTLPNIVLNSYSESGILLLGPIPVVKKSKPPLHVMFAQHKGVGAYPCYFYSYGYEASTKIFVAKDDMLGFGQSGPFNANETYFEYEKPYPISLLNLDEDRFLVRLSKFVPGNPGVNFVLVSPNGMDEKLIKSYEAARSARFEHGESG